MNRNNSSIKNAVNAVLVELKQQSELNDSTIFEYKPKLVGRVAAYANIDDQKKILRLLNKWGDIKLTERLVHNDITRQFKEMGGLPDDLINSMKSDRIIVDVSKTNFSEANSSDGKSASVSILFDGEAIYLKIANDNKKRQIGKLSYDSAMHKIFEKLMSQQPGVPFESASIFNERRNLRQIIIKNRYRCLFTLLDINTYTITRRPEPVIISQAELKAMISQINAKYRKNFKDLE